jgi:hypothetical protein
MLRLEGLREKLHPRHIDLSGDRAHQYDRNRASAAAQTLDEPSAIQPRHLDVRKDQIDPRGLHLLEGFKPIGRLSYGVAFVLEHTGHYLSDRGLIVDDEHSRGCGLGILRSLWGCFHNLVRLMALRLNRDVIPGELL